MANEGITWNHSNDVIFSKNSFLNFVSLIQAHGDLTKLQFFSMRDNVPDGEFTTTEKQQHKRDIAVVRYDLPLDTANPTTTDQQQQIIGRHQFLKTGDDVTISTGEVLGTLNVQVNDTTANIYVKGFSAVSNTASSVKFSGNLLPSTTYTYSLGDSNFRWKNIYANNLNISAATSTDKVSIAANVAIGSAAAPRTFTINGRSINFTSLPTATGAITQFLRGDGTWSNSLPGSLWSSNADSTVDLCNGVIGNSGRIYFYSHGSNSSNHNIGIYGINKSGSAVNVLYITPDNNTVHFGAPCQFHSGIVGNLDIGSAATAVTVKINGRTLGVGALPSSVTNTTVFLRGNGTWGNTLDNRFISTFQSGTWVNSLTQSALTLPNTSTGYNGWVCGPTKNGNITISTYPDATHGTNILYFGYGARGRTTNSFEKSMTWDGSTGYLTANRVYNAVFNDYAECRKTIDLEPGRVVVDNDDGSLSCSSQRLQPGAQVISDTYGHSMGETDDCKTPLAVAGRVLVYTYQPRENYHAGMAVCSAPNGTIDIMTREEIVQYPDCIIGIVSEIPNYNIWGTNEVKVDGRIWIKVR